MTIVVGGAILGAGVLGAGATYFASTQQQKSQAQAIQEQQQQQQAAISALQQGQAQGFGAIQQYETPFINFAQGQQQDLGSLQSTIKGLLTPGPEQNAALSSLPGFQFTKDIALEGVQAGAGQRGFSGSTALAGGQLANNLALTNWQNLVNPLLSLYGQESGLYGTGASAANQAASGAASIATGTAGGIAGVQTGTGANISQLLATQGQTQAAGITGAAGGIGNALTLNALIGGLKNKNPGAVPDPNAGLYPNLPG